ncbi:MAG: hypothetical protein H0T46_36635 [Deltaproteobacteria bacterium]|nr:hypothetical protein [Deltaproteobacteria bacterium]
MLRIKLRYDDVESMVQRFAPNVGKSGLFLPTKSLQPVGAEVKFELRIANDTPVLVGLGRVKAARAPDPAAPRAAFGMAIELMRVTRESREVILKMLARRKEMGLPEIGIPMPTDIDTARRSEVVDTQVKDTASTAVPAPSSSIDSGPSEALLTSPRRQSGPLAIAKLHVVEALAPEAPRKKRPAIHEVIESASGPIVSVVSVPGLDDDVDVGAVLARARVLAGGNLDAELEALREVAAAPLEVSIEAASAELARQLGGKAVSKKDRSARWAPPPEVAGPIVAKPQALVVESSPAIEVPEEKVDTAVESPPSPQPVPTLVDDEDSAPVHAAPMTPAELRTDPANVPLIHDDVDPAAFDARENSANEVEPDQIADEIHQLEEHDFEEVEHTQVGSLREPEPEPEPDSFQQHAFLTEPAVAEAIERSMDAQLADAEAEADEDDMGISGAYQLPPQSVPDVVAAPLHLEDVPEELEEIDDFEILAEADEEDADLLASHGEADASGDHDLDILRARAPREPEPEHEPEPRASSSDFVSRLDLSDEFEAAPEPELDTARPRPFSELDHRLERSAGHALAAFDEPSGYTDRPSANLDDLDGDSNYTVAERSPPPADLFDAPDTGFGGHAAYDPDDLPSQYPISARNRAFDQSDVPQTLRGPKPTAPPGPQPGDEGYDLETALEALDVDLDDLSVPHERPVTKPPRPNTKIPKRATTTDGVLIEFDDEEGDPIPE